MWNRIAIVVLALVALATAQCPGASPSMGATAVGSFQPLPSGTTVLIGRSYTVSVLGNTLLPSCNTTGCPAPTFTQTSNTGVTFTPTSFSLSAAQLSSQVSFRVTGIPTWANFTCSSNCDLYGQANTQLGTYGPTGAPFDVTSCVGVRSLAFASQQTDPVTFDQWSSAFVVHVVDGSGNVVGLESTDTMTFSVRVFRTSDDTDVSGSCTLSASSITLTGAQSSSAFRVSCPYNDGADLEAGQTLVVKLFLTSSAAGTGSLANAPVVYFYPNTASAPSSTTAWLISSGWDLAQYTIVPSVTSASSVQIGTASSLTVTLTVQDVNGNVVPVGPSQGVTVSYSFGSVGFVTALPASVAFTAGETTKSFVIDATALPGPSDQSTPFNSDALLTAMKLAFTYNNANVFALATVSTTITLTKLDLIIDGADKEAVLGQTVPFTLRLQGGQLTGTDSLIVNVYSDAADTGLLLSSSATGTFGSTATLTLTAGSPSVTFYAQAPKNAADQFDTTTTIVSSFTVYATDSSMRYSIDIDDSTGSVTWSPIPVYYVFDSNSDDLLAGQSRSLAITVGAAPPTSLTVSIVLQDNLAQWTVSPSTLTFLPTGVLRQSVTMTFTGNGPFNGDTSVTPAFFLSGPDQGLYAMDDASSVSVSAASTGYVSWNVLSNSLYVGRWSDPIFVQPFPAVINGLTITLTPSNPNLVLSTSSLVFTAGSAGSQSFRVRSTGLPYAASSAVALDYSVYLSYSGPDAPYFAVANSQIDFSVISGATSVTGTTPSSVLVGQQFCVTVSTRDSGGNIVSDVQDQLISVSGATSTANIAWIQPPPWVFPAYSGSMAICGIASGIGSTTVFLQSNGTLYPFDANSFVVTVGAGSVTATASSSSIQYGNGVVILISLSTPAINGLTITPSANVAGVTFDAATATIAPGAQSAQIRVLYTPASGAWDNSITITLRTGGADAGLFASPTPITLTPTRPTFQVVVQPNQATANGGSVAVILSQPAVTDATVTVNSDCWDTAAVVAFAAGDVSHQVTFDANQQLGQSCVFRGVLSGTDAPWYATAAVSGTVAAPAATVGPIGSNFLTLFTSSSFKIEPLSLGESSGTFTLWLPNVPHDVLTITFSSADAVFTPSTLVFSPTQLFNSFYYTVKNLAATQSIATVTFGGPLAAQYQAIYGTNVVVQIPTTPRLVSGGLGSLINVASASGWLAAPNTPASYGVFGVRPTCNTNIGDTGSNVNLAASPILFEPSVLYFDPSSPAGLNVSFTYTVNTGLIYANSQFGQLTCTLSLQLLRPQGTTAGGVVQAYSYSSQRFLGLNQGSAFPITSIVAWTRGLIVPRLRFQLEAKRNVRASLSISPPAAGEFQVQVTAPNLFAGARLVTVPAGASEVDFIVQNFHNPNSPFGVDAFAVSWSILGAAGNNYQMSCGSTQCTTYHRGSDLL
jgi:hypothetical protein